MNKLIFPLLSFTALLIYFFTTRNQDSEILYRVNQQKNQSELVQEVSSIESQDQEIEASNQIVRPPQLGQKPLLKFPATPDQDQHPLTEDGELLVSQVIVIDDYAVVHGDILISTLNEIMDLERKGELPKLAPPTLWPEGVVYYEIAPEVTQVRQIKSVIEFFQKTTPVRFQEFQGEENFVQFLAGDEHCFSNLGMIGGPQKIVLSPACDEKEIAHEIMHTLGFVHEQNREDRDKSIVINWENIEENYDEQFKIIPRSFHLKLNEKAPFDFQSRMLYSPFSFAKEPTSATMTKLNGEYWKQTDELLSPGDIERLKSLY